MSLVKSTTLSVGTIFEEQDTNYIYCDHMEDNILIKKGIYKNNSLNNEVKLSNLDKIVVGKDQCLLIVCNNKILDFTTEPGRYTYNEEEGPSLLHHGFDERLINSFNNSIENINQEELKEFPKEIYYINTRIIDKNKFGTSEPIPYKDNKLNIDINIKCYGEYTIKIIDPIAFYYTYKDIEDDYMADDSFKEQFLEDFLKSIEPSLSKLSIQNISYDMLTESSKELSDVIKENIGETWLERGISLEYVSLASITPTVESIKLIKTMKTTNFDITDDNNKEEAEKKCPNCGTILNIDSKFCPECGERLFD